jgi:hypothetical protein
VSRIGSKRVTWTKELDDRLLSEIQKGKSFVQLELIIGTSHTSICRRLKEMGFDGLKDAREVMGYY